MAYDILVLRPTVLTHLYICSHIDGSIITSSSYGEALITFIGSSRVAVSTTGRGTRQNVLFLTTTTSTPRPNLLKVFAQTKLDCGKPMIRKILNAMGGIAGLTCSITLYVIHLINYVKPLYCVNKRIPWVSSSNRDARNQHLEYGTDK